MPEPDQFLLQKGNRLNLMSKTAHPGVRLFRRKRFRLTHTFTAGIAGVEPLLNTTLGLLPVRHIGVILRGYGEDLEGGVPARSSVCFGSLTARSLCQVKGK